MLFEGIDVLQRYKNKLYFLDDLIKLFYSFLIGIIIIKCITFTDYYPRLDNIIKGIKDEKFSFIILKKLLFVKEKLYSFL